MSESVSKKQERILRAAAEEIRRGREKALEAVQQEILDDLAEFEKKHPDPLQGRGRGPLWAQGGD